MFCRDVEQDKFRLFHKWGKWEMATEKVRILWGYDIVANVSIQVRSCVYCGKIQKRGVR